MHKTSEVNQDVIPRHISKQEKGSASDVIQSHRGRMWGGAGGANKQGGMQSVRRHNSPVSGGRIHAQVSHGRVDEAVVVLVLDVGGVPDLLVLHPAQHGVADVAVDQPHERHGRRLGDPQPHAARHALVKARAERAVALQAHDQHPHHEVGRLAEDCQEADEDGDDQAFPPGRAWEGGAVVGPQAVQQTGQRSRDEDGQSCREKAEDLQGQEVVIANGVGTVLLGHALHQSLVEDGQDEEGGHHPGQQEVEGAVDPGGAAGQGRAPPLREDVDQAFHHQAENSQKRYTNLGVKEKRLKVLNI